MESTEIAGAGIPAGAPPDGKNASRLSTTQRVILGIVLVATMLDLMDAQITNIAAPSIVHNLGGGETLIKWLGATYQLAMGTLLVVGGRLGDRYGNRRLYLAGISGFVAASAICGLAADPAMLIIGRVLQGSFGALLIPQGMAILTATFSREQLPKAFSAFGPVLGLASVGGPILGGFLVSANLGGLHWRPVFLVNIVLGGAGLLAALKFLPHLPATTPDERIDTAGSGILGLMMLGLIFGLIQGSTSGWTALPIVSLAVGAVLFPVFALRQRHSPNPLIKASLLKNRGFTAGLILALMFFAATAGFSYLVSLFFQLVLRYSAARAALGLSPAAAGFIVAAIISQPLLKRLGRTLVVAALASTVAGALGVWGTVLAYGTGVTAWLTAPAIFVMGIGMGACITALFDVAIGDIDHTEAGSASGTFSSVQQLASAIGAAVVTTVYFDLSHHHHGATPATFTIMVVAAMMAACLALVWLLPRKAAEQNEFGSGE
jgi:EmrB/QacA subfamily drug resistance transporter